MLLVGDKGETRQHILEQFKAKLSPSAAFLFSTKPPPPRLKYPPPPNRSYKAPSRHVRVLKASMRFVPLLNNTPNALTPSDPPYLFNVRGRVVSYASEDSERKKMPPPRCIPRPLSHEEVYDTVELECGARNVTQRVKRIQEQLMIAYRGCYETASEASRLAGDSPAMYGVGRDRADPYDNDDDKHEMIRRWTKQNYGSAKYNEVHWLGTMLAGCRENVQIPPPPTLTKETSDQIAPEKKRN